MGRHDALFRDCLSRFAGVEYDHTGDGFFAIFERPSDALRCALAFQQELPQLDLSERLSARVGIHMGEVVTKDLDAADKRGKALVGLAIDMTARIMGLAQGNQILLTSHAFDSARQHLRETVKDSPIVWLSHGPYRFKGTGEPVDVYEAGLNGVSPLTSPPDSEKAVRVVSYKSRTRTLVAAALVVVAVTIAIVGWSRHGAPADQSPTGLSVVSGAPWIELLFKEPHEQETHQKLSLTSIPLETGSKIQVHVQLPQEGFPYLYYLAKNERPFLMYPKDGRHSGPIRQFATPDWRDDQWQTIAPPSGTDMLLLLVTDKPADNLSRLETRLASLNWPALSPYQYMEGDADSPVLRMNETRSLDPTPVQAPKGILRESVGQKWRDEFRFARVLAFPHVAPSTSRIGGGK